MELFIADDHYGARPGWHLFDAIKEDYPDMLFHENDCSVFDYAWEMKQCSLLILNLLAGDEEMSQPGSDSESNVKKYLERGGNILLLHCGSAAFEQWSWWQPLVGLRWVRPNDSTGLAASTHPVRPYQVKVVKSSHPLSHALWDMDLPEDEIYIHLQQTCPITVLMETTTKEGVFCQCCESVTPWGGRLVSFLPGHDRAAVTHPNLIYNVKQIIDHLMTAQGE